MRNRYFKIWLLLSLKSARIALNSRFGAIFFSVGKVIRFFLFIGFILVIESKTKNIVGYSIWQIIFFFATFNLIDILSQLFLREVYQFRSYVVSGDFDYFLVKPLSPLFRALFGGSDVLDFPVLIASIFFLMLSAGHIGNINLINTLFYVLLVINALFIALSFHIFVLGICILTTEIDNTLWTYRDLIQLGRFPIDIYREPLRGFLTFIIPIGIMITFPAKMFMGFLSTQLILVAFFVSVVFLGVSLYMWKYSLRKYSSASS